MHQMKNISISLIIKLSIIFTILTSCGDDSTIGSEFDCYYCYDEMPEYVGVKFLTNNKIITDTVFFTIFSGNAYESEIDYETFTTMNETTIDFIPNRPYTAVAEYHKDGKIYQVINDFTPKTQFFEYACDVPCYYEYETIVDLELKY